MEQEIIKELYQPKRFDRFKYVSRREFEQRDIRTKIDIADLYKQLDDIKNALKEKGIIEQEISCSYDDLLGIVRADVEATHNDLAHLHYQERIDAYKRGSIVERLRRLFIGEPIHPDAAIEIAQPETTGEQELINLIANIEQKGGIDQATLGEKDKLKQVIAEIREVAKQADNQTTVI